MLSNVLIIDKRRELSTKYRKCLEEEQTDVNNARSLNDAIKFIRQSEPDLIIVSDSIEEDLAIFCSKIRSLTYDTRPTIIALSKSADIGDKIKILDNGADDFLSEPVNIEEFKMRIRAHLRRDLESNLDNVTLLPSKKYVLKFLRRLLKSENKQAVMLLSVENLESYRSVYSDIAGDKLLQTLVAITKSTLDKNDFLGQLSENSFIIITSPYGAEKMAAFLTFAFDTVTPKFYSEQDAKRGYTLLQGDREAGMRVNFVSILIGGIIDNYEMITSTDVLISKLMTIKKIAKIPSGSNYAIDRIKLTGENSVIEPKLNRSIYINEPDEALAFLLKTALKIQGYEIVEKFDINTEEQPGILILDSNEDMSGLNLCRDLKERFNFANSKIIVTSTTHDKSAILNAGADLYLPKPYEISDLIMWIEYLFKE